MTMTDADRARALLPRYGLHRKLPGDQQQIIGAMTEFAKAEVALAFATPPMVAESGEVDSEEFERGKDEGADYVLSHLAELCGLERWEQKDGSETWDGDVSATLCGILEDARVLDPWDNSVAKHAVLHEEPALRALPASQAREGVLDIDMIAKAIQDCPGTVGFSYEGWCRQAAEAVAAALTPSPLVTPRPPRPSRAIRDGP